MCSRRWILIRVAMLKSISVDVDHGLANARSVLAFGSSEDLGNT